MKVQVAFTVDIDVAEWDFIMEGIKDTVEADVNAYVEAAVNQRLRSIGVLITDTPGSVESLRSIGGGR